MMLSIRPVTSELWPALVDLFGDKGPCSRCWCMYWRIGPAYRKIPAAENKASLHQLVKQGPPPGLIACDGERAVGWCQLTPREALPWLDRTWQPADHRSVWSISCFYVAIGFRKRGVTTALIDAAIKVARRGGARILEAYPLDADLSPSSTGTGYVSTFARAGFKVVGYRTPPRPIMQLELRVKERKLKPSGQR